MGEVNISRRDFLKLMGLGSGAIVLAPVLASCAPELSGEGKVEALSELTEKIKRATLYIDVTLMPEYVSNQAMERRLGGTGIIFGETDKSGERNTLALLTVRHVIYTGYFIRKLTLANPFGKYGAIVIDATAGAPRGREVRADEWSIQNIFDIEDGNVVLHLERPADSQPLTSGTIYIDKRLPREDEEYLAVGCPFDKNRRPVISRVTFIKFGYDTQGNRCWLMDDPTNLFGEGASGGPVFRGENLFGIIQGGNRRKNLLYVTPAASALTYNTTGSLFKSLAEWTQFMKDTTAGGQTLPLG